MELKDLLLNRYLYKDSSQSLETKDSAFVAMDSSAILPTPIPAGGAAQDINISNVEINGFVIIPGSIPPSTLDVSNWGWSQSCVFTSATINTVTWGAGTFTSANGVAYAIGAGTTGVMAAKTYIYLDLNVSATAYQVTTVSANSVGAGKVIIAVAIPGTVAGTLAAYNLSEASQIVSDNILANTINVSKLLAGIINSQSIVLASTTADSEIRTGIAAGDFNNTGGATGFILGADYSDSSKGKFYVGTPTSYLKFDGTNTDVTQARYIGLYTCGENIAVDKVVCIAAGGENVTISKDSYIDSLYPDDNFGGSEDLIASNYTDILNGQRDIFLTIPTSGGSIPIDKRIIKVEFFIYCWDFYYNNSLGGPNLGATLLFNRVTAAWDEGTITYNTEPASGDTLPDYFTLNETANIPYSPSGHWFSLDVTQVWKRWQNSELTNNGVKITIVPEAQPGVNKVWAKFRSSDYVADPSLRPYIAVTYYDNDGDVYVANCDDYKLCRQIIGISAETKTTGQTIKILENGSNSDLVSATTGGFREYLTATGTLDNAGASQDRHILIGTENSSRNTTLIDIQDTGYLVETIPNMPAAGSALPIYCQADAMKAIISLEYALDANYFYAGPVEIRKGDTVVMNNLAGEYLTITWNIGNAETITFAVTSGGSFLYYDVKFYN